MDLTVQPPNESIREIEDILDIQKANGSFDSGRQVGFGPAAPAARARAGLARSLESGLAGAECGAGAANNKRKKQRAKRPRSPPPPDVVSWPSDSDVTVLRMRLCAGGPATPAPGDGSSMVNLATLVPRSRSPSKRSLAPREYLLPVTSWEPPPPPPAAARAGGKVARFVRLYFCPCCACLYEIEKTRDATRHAR